MVTNLVKAGAAVALFLANAPLVASQIRAEDPAAGAQAQYKTASFEVAKTQVATTTYENSKSDNEMSPVPETGTTAMLITGICMLGFAARRRRNVA